MCLKCGLKHRTSATEYSRLLFFLVLKLKSVKEKSCWVNFLKCSKNFIYAHLVSQLDIAVGVVFNNELEEYSKDE